MVILRTRIRKEVGILLMKANPQGEWNRVAEQMMMEFSESGHPVFRYISPLSRGVLQSKGGGKLSIQLSNYGAVSDSFDE